MAFVTRKTVVSYFFILFRAAAGRNLIFLWLKGHICLYNVIVPIR